MIFTTSTPRGGYKTGWNKIGGNRYYLDPSGGAMRTSGVVDGYRIGSDGIAKKIV